MTEYELKPKELSEDDNTVNVEMSKSEIWFLKHFIKKYHPKKIVEVGIASGGNTVNLLKWKNKSSKLFSVDLSKYWFRDESKLTGFMAMDYLGTEKNWKLYTGYDYLDVYEEIGNDIDCIIIDTTHEMPGECLTFLAALPQLKDGCIVVLHDIHLNSIRLGSSKSKERDYAKFCTTVLFGSVRSDKKWILSTDGMSNIGAFVVDKSTRDHIKDLFHTLSTSWYNFPSGLNFFEYKKFMKENYSKDCSKLFNAIVDAYANYFDVNVYNTSDRARVDVINKNDSDNKVEIISTSDNVDVLYPDWFEYEYGKGVVLETEEKSVDVKLKCIGDGMLDVSLRGPDVRMAGKRVPSYVNYTKFRVNNKNIFNETTTAFHDNSYIFSKEVKDGETVEIHFEWEYYFVPTIPFDYEESFRC